MNHISEAAKLRLSKVQGGMIHNFGFGGQGLPKFSLDVVEEKNNLWSLVIALPNGKLCPLMQNQDHETILALAQELGTACSKIKG